ncbi:hypothetical protein [Halogeometricum borinquense]|nr:hypothetical protein [Halogeometricum borinquense]
MATCRDDEAFVRELDGDAGDASLAMWPRRKRNAGAPWADRLSSG